MDYSNSQIRDLIAEYVHSEKDRQILQRRLIDGITFERLAEEFEMSPKAIRIRIHKQEQILFRHLPG